MTAADVRVPRARLIVYAAAVVVGATLLWLTRTYTFYFDEWDFILTSPDWTLQTYLQPHNEHPVMLTRLLYAVLLHTVGMRTYLPYMATLLAAHAATVILLFEIVRRRAGDLVALACAALLLVLGAGWEDLLWAFQIAFVGAVAFGLGGHLLLENHPRIAVLPLAASVMFSGIGLFFFVAAIVRVMVDRGRRRGVLWLLPLAVAVAGWYVAFDRSTGPGAPGIQPANVVALPAYVGWGIAAGAGGLVGVGGWAAVGAGLLALAAVGFTWWRRRPDAFAIGIAAALVSFYAMTGLTRAQFGYDQSGAGRYVYVGAVFWLLLLGDAVRSLPWTGTWRPALAACVFLACFNDAALLVTYAYAKTVQMQRATADLQALAAERGDPCLDSTAAVDPLVMPWITSPALYYRAVDRYGGAQANAPIADMAAYRAARSRLHKPGC